MNIRKKTLSIWIINLAVTVLVSASPLALIECQQSQPQSQEPPSATKANAKTENVPTKQNSPAKPERPHAYHKEPPAGPLPATLDPQEVASKIQRPEAVPAAIVVYS